jgi:2-polyprenyl-3-methyl-5-hydroxy-6-metoxy-1,4-benzoquinol methylase
METWKDARFLDVGCGMGRNSYWPMKWGAAGGAAIDVDQRSLSSAGRTLREYPSVDVCQKSVYDLAEENVFDIVFSIGVIHHLSDPQLALQKMVAATKPEGQVLVWVYGRENNGWIVWLANPLRKVLFSACLFLGCTPSPGPRPE